MYLQQKNGALLQWNGTIYSGSDQLKKGSLIGAEISAVLTTERSNPNRVEQIKGNLLDNCPIKNGREENPSDLFSCLNGWISLKDVLANLSRPHKVELITPTPQVFMTRQVNGNFDLNSNCPKFEKFLRESCPGYEQSIFEYIGYCLHKSAPMQKSLLLVGPPGTGKSTLLMVLEEIFGEEYCVSNSWRDLEEKQFAGSAIDGMYANICADIPDAALKSMDFFKRVAAGDRVQTEAKYQDSKSIKSTCKLIFSINNFPKGGPDTAGVMDRILHAYFGTRYRHTENQKWQEEFVAEMFEEADGIVTKSILDYAMAYKNKGFTITEIAEERSRDYEQSMDPEIRFLRSCLTYTGDEEDMVGSKEIREHFKAWCEIEGEFVPKSPRKLYGFIRQEFSDVIETEEPVDTIQQKVFCGVKFEPMDYVSNYVDEQSSSNGLL